MSEDWGASRGGAIDRYYIDSFIAPNVRGRAGRFLEFGNPRYRRFTLPELVTAYDIIDSNPKNELATIRCDVEDLCRTTGKTFDVIICTQVLQYVKSPTKAVDQLRVRIPMMSITRSDAMSITGGA